MKKDTSWGGVSDWYDEHLKNNDTYHAKVLLPNILRLVGPKSGMKILDIACGQGFFSAAFADAGADVSGIDIAAPLVAIAKKNVPGARFFVSPASDLSFIPDSSVDTAVCVLALQNIENVSGVFREVMKKLKPEGNFFIILNHPAFRIPGRSSWGFEEGVEYRRLDGYLSESKNEIDMTPGAKGKHETTVSFHRPLQVWFKTLANAGFAVSRLEEWVSHRESGTGPRKAAEDRARKEFPLFLCLQAAPFLRAKKVV